MTTLKLILTSKANLSFKYGSQFTALKQLFSNLIAADKANGITTKVVYIDDATSTKAMGVKPVATVKERNCKDITDQLYKKHKPAYIVIFGAQDIFPFQELKNDLYSPGDDDDMTIASDLPYACDSAYSKNVGTFVNPVRVVGRIPDVPGKPDLPFVKVVINNIINQKPKKPLDYSKYFAVTAQVWTKSTEQSITNVFGKFTSLLESPPAKGGYTKSQLAPLSHFYNCHGGKLDPDFYGQKGNNYPVALKATDVVKKTSTGTVVAAECCYGAQVMDPSLNGASAATSYLANNALSFMGSSTIAYGPASGQGLADLICQYFLIHVHEGASTGRAMLEARQEFLNVSGPHLDPYELKTLAQFYILGDPSVSLVKLEVPKEAAGTVENRRLNLFSKGISIGQSVAPSVKMKSMRQSKHRKDVGEILKETGFRKETSAHVFETRFRAPSVGEMKKMKEGGTTRYRTFEKSAPRPKGLTNIKVLIIKENDDQVLGYRVYVSR